MKRFIYHSLSLVAIAGLFIAVWPAGQTAYGYWSQRTLRTEWDAAAKNQAAPKSQTAATTPGPKAAHRQITTAPAPKPVAAKPKQRHLATWPPTRLVIPEQNLDVVVVQGTESWNLQHGPGHEVTSAGPGQEGNCVILGHRNICGSWFYNLDQLVPGAEVRLVTTRHTYTYHITTVTSVSESDTSVLQAGTGVSRLTLITCTSPHSTSRIVVIADLYQTDE
ncbi:MAG TPA: class D sortase [Verrucomicrobiae bacterium]|nr:class D sortase [Verrucomicrobiae bacterium]